MQWPLSDYLVTQTPILEIAARMALAVVFGMIIGIEREVRQRPAGLRTHMLISLAAAVFTLLTFELTMTAVSIDNQAIRADPVRVTQAVVAGVAFLGAGSIIRARGELRGITTGASIWLAGAIGVACGGGYYAIAALTLVFAMVILSVVGLLERRLSDTLRHRPPDA
jgi:putative Mg2+ transporter-C (MgtC) family protein